MVTATFRADFTSFVDAVAKAETELKSFETGAAKVERSLGRMTDAFSGRRVIQEATQMARVFSDMGDGAHLTESELKRMGSTANEAIAKLKAMGLDVPPGIQKIADATKNTGTAFDALKGPLGGVNGLLGVFGASIGIGAVVNFGKALLDDADALVKMSDRTGVSITGLQRLQLAGDDAGNTIEDMTGAINQMQNRLDGGDASAVGALRRLGLSLGDLKGLAPDQQFIAISDALREVDNPAQQVAIAMDLFGKTGAQVLPTLKRGFDDVRDAAVGMSEDTARALDSAGDELEKFTRQAKGVGAELLVTIGRYGKDALNPLALGLNVASHDLEAMRVALTGALDTAAKRAPDLQRAFGVDLSTQFEVGEAALKAFDRQMDEGRRLHEASAAAAKKHGEEVRQLAAALDQARLKAADLEATVGRGTFTGPSPESGVSEALAQARQRAAELARQDTLTGRGRTGVPTLQAGANPQLAALSQTFGKGLSDMLTTQLPQSIMAAITGGGSKLEAIGSTFGSFLTSPKGFGGAISKGLTSVFGSAFGGALNALVPGLGSLMGPLLSAMGKKIKALFGGPSEAELGGRDLEKQFEQTFGSFENMVNAIGEAYRATGRTSEDAQRDVKALLDAEKQGPAAVQAWIDKFNEALEKSKSLRASDTGTAAAVIDQERARIQSAIDGLTKQRDDLLGSVANEAPEKVMGVIEAGIRGQAAGIQAQIDQQQRELGRMTDRAAADLQDALGDIKPNVIHVPVVFDVEDFPSLNGRVEPVPGAATGARVTSSGLQHLAAGGFARRGTDTVPAMLTPGELVLNAAQQKNIAGALRSRGADSGAGEELSVLRGHIEQQVAMLARLPKDIARAVRDKRQLSLVRSRRAW